MSGLFEVNPNLVESYQSLDCDSKIIIRLFALINHGVDLKFLSNNLKQQGVLTAAKEHFSEGMIRSIADALIKKQLLIFHKHMAEYGVDCNNAILHAVLKDAVKQQKLLTILQSIQNKYQIGDYYNFSRVEQYFARDIRALVYANNYDGLQEYCASQKVDDYGLHILQEITSVIPFDKPWMLTLSGKMQGGIIRVFLDNNYFNLVPCDAIIDFILENIATLSGAREMLANYYLLTGEHEQSAYHLQHSADPYSKALLHADLLFCQNQLEEAIEEYQSALKILRKNTRVARTFFSDYHGIFYLFAVVSHLGESTALQLINKITPDYQTMRNVDLFRKLIYVLQGKESTIYQYEMERYFEKINLTSFLSLMLIFWIDPKAAATNLTVFVKYFNHAAKNGYKLFARIYAEILAKLSPQSPQYEIYAQTEVAGIKLNFGEIITIKPAWEIFLNQLTEVSATVTANIAQAQTGKRLVWLLDTSERLSDEYLLKPAEQARNAKGNSWKIPREIPLKKFYEEPPFYLIEQDKKIRETLSKGDYSNFKWNVPATLSALIGHPHICDMRNKECKLELSEGQAHLLVAQHQDDFKINLSNYATQPGILLRKETDRHYKVIKIDATLVKLSNILGSSGITVPAHGKDMVLAAIEKLADNITVHSEIEVQSIPGIQTSSKLEVQLMPYGEGLSARIVVRPFADFGDTQYPGSGSKIILGAHRGQKMQGIRNFAEEKKNLKQLLKNCRALSGRIQNFQAIVEEPLECLKLLAELKTLEDCITIAWPRGEMVQVKANLSFDNLKLRVRKNKDWFAVEGEIIVDNKKFMSIKELLDLIDYNDDPFIPLSTDKFISLSEHFKQQLQKLKNTAMRDANGYHIHKLAAFAAGEIISDCKNVDLDNAWKEQLGRLADTSCTNALPDQAHFKAVLRQYQIEGYNWLNRMAAWEMGVCLADDMGLGKTVQAIAALLTRAKDGASLVVAPTSVCYNWVNEINKFAPILKPHLFAELDREALLKNVGEYDVVICSYGLVQRNIHLLHKISWGSVILDEAQAIKNSTAKRTQAMYQLQGKFRLALTGTPIENHLGELWSLFRFLNPGFLGNEESFYKRFTVPIEQYKNEYARTTLKNLIKPFVLRRMKNAVLKDLPPKTELTVFVDLSEEERAFYEALRVRAIEAIENIDADFKEGQKQFKILAEITKLRLACCHSTLVRDEIDLPSSKLQQFAYLLNDVLENKHRVLVFSQFVRYLEIVKRFLEEKKITYQYLDGQTPQKQRKEIIDNFNNGEDSVFLLSLKAGGVGLNLTAADYVILLDPWWNPAVENQAADRAHRIGQTKPVTIYRLISKQTIEEKILELHQTKKDLANDLLSDSDLSGKLTAKELLKLISTSNGSKS